MPEYKSIAIMITLASPVRPDAIRRSAARIRIRSLEMVQAAGLGHPGGDLSAADILAALFLGVLRFRPEQPMWPERDRFIMSKGHCSAAYYCALAEAGILAPSALSTYMQPFSTLNGHPDRNKAPGVEANTGPLGHGLPIAVGCALGAKMDGAEWRTFVLTGDGELQEGSNWEAAMAASHYKLDNLTLIIDRNKIQQGDFTENTIGLEPLAERWRAFGWSVTEIDGGNVETLLGSFRALTMDSGKPSCIIAHTVKGQGVSFMKGRPEWHHKIPTTEQLRAAVLELREELY